MCSDAEKLRKKLVEWKSWMGHDDDHTIYSQIHQMLWEDAVFRMVNECWRICPGSDDGGIRFNSDIHGLIVRNFLQIQAIYIRRLAEKNDEKKPTKSVVSLRRLLDEALETAPLLRRRVFLEAHVLPYDTHEGEGTPWVGGMQPPTPELNARRRAASVHKDFDSWNFVTEETRRPEDGLKPEILQDLQSKLDVCESIKQFVDKNVAHAAHQSNRFQIPSEAQTICLGKIWKCHKSICLVASTLCSTVLLEDFPSPLPGCHDQLEHLDQPWIQPDQAELIRDEWDKHREEVQGWCQTTPCCPGANDFA